MATKCITFKVGTRSSNLSMVQTKDALDRIKMEMPGISFKIISMSSPGDEDQTTNLQSSDPNFFTKYLDTAVLSGELDFAIHSAKDVSEFLDDQLDWFWLPWKEDPKDVLILRPDESIQELVKNPVIGISSDRRQKYATRRFPGGKLKNVRGTIENRLAALDRGEYDLLIMAAAALNRLNLQSRITEIIPISELQPPKGQGCLSLIFRKTDKRVQQLRSLFLYPAVFVSGGPGHEDLCTVAGVKALNDCDVCLYDALVAHRLLDYLKDSTEQVDCGKRRGKYTLSKHHLEQSLVDCVKQGKKVVRLKGGDAGVFGRLAEEISALERWRLPFRVIPGVGSLNASTTGTGFLLTRRGLSRGYTVITPWLADGNSNHIDAAVRGKLSLVFFMAVSKTREIVNQLLEEGRSCKEHAAMIFGAGTTHQEIITGSLENIADLVDDNKGLLPGLLIIGAIANRKFKYATSHSALQSKRVLITCSDILQERAEKEVLNYGGIPVKMPLIRLVPNQSAIAVLSKIQEFDWVTLTSPSSVRCLMDLIIGRKIDVRKLPKIIVPGEGVNRELQRYGLMAEVVPDSKFSADSMVKLAAQFIKKNDKLLRLRSDLADKRVENAFHDLGACVTDCVIYQNKWINYSTVPEFDAVVFASSSAVSAFTEYFTHSALTNKLVVAIGQPTADALSHAKCSSYLVADEATIEASLRALAAQYVFQEILNFESGYSR